MISRGVEISITGGGGEMVRIAGGGGEMVRVAGGGGEMPYLLVVLFFFFFFESSVICFQVQNALCSASYEEKTTYKCKPTAHFTSSWEKSNTPSSWEKFPPLST